MLFIIVMLIVIVLVGLWEAFDEWLDELDER